jgi:putative transposase
MGILKGVQIMDIEKFVEWKKRQGYNIASEQMVQMIYETGSTREVQSKVGNVVTLAPSLDDGCGIYTESRTVEYVYQRMLENDPDAEGFITQPLPIHLRYEQNGKTVDYTYTADFFVFRSRSGGYVETKTETELIKLSERQPERYKKIDGVWRSPPAEAAAAKYGLTFTIVSDAEFNPVYIQNIDYLQSYMYVRDKLNFESEILEQVMRTVSAYPGITLKELREEVEGVTADDINGMLVKRLIWVDMTANLLTMPEKVKTYSSKNTAAAIAKYQPVPEIGGAYIEYPVKGMEIGWRGLKWQITDVVDNDIWLEGENGEQTHIARQNLHKWEKEGKVQLLSAPQERQLAKELRRKYSEEQWHEAAKKCEAVEQFLVDGTLPPGFDKDPKTIKRWADKYQYAKQIYGDGIYGLLPQHHLKGCKKVRVDIPRLKILIPLFKKYYLSEECLSKASAFNAIVEDAKRAGIVPPSRRLFNSMCDGLDPYEKELARAGQRAAQKFKEPVADPNRFPAEGQWFMHRVHIDHVQLPVQIWDPEVQKAIGKPWLTLLTDSATRSAVGTYLTLESPSRRSTLMAIRDMGLRFRKLPEYIISDNGKDFKSYDYKCLVSRYRGTLQWRPPSEAEFGAPVERQGEIVQQMLINNLRGRTFPSQEDRLRTGKLKPETRAVWPLNELKVEVEKFLYEDYDKMKLPGILMSPCEARALSREDCGARAHRMFEPDAEFIFLTTPVIRTKQGFAKVVPGRGIKTERDWYTCEEFKTPGVARTKVQVRKDPSNPDRCYACVKGEYVPLRRHLTNSVVKKQYKSGSYEVLQARRRATEQANYGLNLEIRGNMMARIKEREAELTAQKTAAASKDVVLRLVKKPTVFKPAKKRAT